MLANDNNNSLHFHGYNSSVSLGDELKSIQLGAINAYTWPIKQTQRTTHENFFFCKKSNVYYVFQQ